MKHFLALLSSLLILVSVNCHALVPARSHVIGFYNVENLFDAKHDEGKNDREFLPGGANDWTEEKYGKKLRNIARVINSMAADNGQYHSILGLAEVENDKVLKDLVSLNELSQAGFSYIHRESPDSRGIDVALLYRKECFKPLETLSIAFDFKGSSIKFDKSSKEQKSFRTRDILMVRGWLQGEMFAFFVAHLPSRLGNKGEDLRCRGAEIILNKSRELERKYPGIKIVVMGDMNDNPTDLSMTKYMNAVENIKDAGKGCFFSPFISMLKDGYGSLEYRGSWNIFDIIMVNGRLCNKSCGLSIQKSDDSHYGYVYKKTFMTHQSGQYKGTPFRSFSKNEFTNGYSDHYPTYIIIGK